MCCSYYTLCVYCSFLLGAPYWRLMGSSVREEVESARRWRSSARNLEVAVLPGWGAGGQRGDPWGRRPSSAAGREVQGHVPEEFGGWSPTQVSTRAHPGPEEEGVNLDLDPEPLKVDSRGPSQF